MATDNGGCLSPSRARPNHVSRHPHRSRPPRVDHRDDRRWRSGPVCQRCAVRGVTGTQREGPCAGSPGRGRAAGASAWRTPDRGMAWQASVRPQAIAGRARFAGPPRRSTRRPAFPTIGATRVHPKRCALRRPEIVVLEAVCTYLGCIPTFRPTPGVPDLGASWPGGFYCPCHGSKFDLAGRVFKRVPAPTNLTVPPYQFASGSTLLIGVDPKT